ncbi:MAG: hypothetical protein KC493_12330 [Bacteriovoracaceae bacterium]|nr:hypothetical protein [Bacteriovoracaceae bacterium]
MKKILFFLIFISTTAMAGKGVVVTLEAPLLSGPSFETRPVQHVRKGQLIYIHDKHFGNADYEITFTGYIDESSEDYNKISDGIDKEGFFQTLDKSGNPAFIEKKYVKLIYFDDREKHTNVNPWKNDPTDYRLEEPLPKNYPLYRIGGLRASAALSFGPSRKLNYPYTSDIIREDYTGRLGGEFTFSKRVDFDKYDRFYFGGMGHVYTSFGEFFLQNDIETEEFSSELGVGPMISYYFFRGQDWGASLNSGITINWQRILIKQRGNGESEERIFSGFTFTPKMQLHLIRSNLIPEIDLMFGANFQFNIDSGLTSGAPAQIENLWQDESDQYTLPTGGIFSLFFGIHNSY